MSRNATPILIAVLLLTAFSSGCKEAIPDADYGISLFEGGDYKGALEEFKKAAAEGNSEAQYRLALMYNDGRGVDTDPIEAYAWMRTAVENGHTRAKLDFPDYDDALTGMARVTGMKKSNDYIGDVFFKAGERKDRENLKTFGVVLLGIGLALFLYMSLVLRSDTGASAAGADPDAFQGMNQTALARAVADPAECERIARFYEDAGLTWQFLQENDAQSQQFYQVFAEAFSRAGNNRAAEDIRRLAQSRRRS